MGGLMLFFLLFLAFGALGALALTLGVDSRPDFEDPRSPARGLTT